MNREILKNIGQELRDNRLAANITLKMVSDKLKIRKIYLKAIENGDINILKFDAYTIGYIKQYTEFLQRDPKTYIERIKNGQTSTLTQISSHNLITGKEFLPSKVTMTICLILLILIYIFVEFVV